MQYDYAYGVVNLNDGVVDTSNNTGQLARVNAFIGGSVSTNQAMATTLLLRFNRKT